MLPGLVVRPLCRKADPAGDSSFANPVYRATASLTASARIGRPQPQRMKSSRETLSSLAVEERVSS